MVQTTQTIYDQYLYLFDSLTKALVNFFSYLRGNLGMDRSADEAIPRLLHDYVEEYLAVEQQFNAFLTIVAKVEVLINRETPRLQLLPRESVDYIATLLS
jgi:hypothetical protein